MDQIIGKEGWPSADIIFIMRLTKLFYSVMNDDNNNDFVTFVFMVLLGNHRLLFWSFGIVPRDKFLRLYHNL